MPEPITLSVGSLIADVAEGAIAGLNRLGEERGLSATELEQLAAFEALAATIVPLLPPSRGMYMLVPPGTPLSTTSIKEPMERLQRCAEVGGRALVDLLGMRATVPADWHRLPLNTDTVLWFGVTCLAEELSLICASGHSSPQRQAQLAAIRDLQGALGRVIRLERAGSPERDRTRAEAKVESAFVRASRVIEHSLPDIRAEADALKAPRR